MMIFLHGWRLSTKFGFVIHTFSFIIFSRTRISMAKLTSHLFKNMMPTTIIGIKISCLVTGHGSKPFVFIFVYPLKLYIFIVDSRTLLPPIPTPMVRCLFLSSLEVIRLQFRLLLVTPNTGRFIYQLEMFIIMYGRRNGLVLLGFLAIPKGI